MTLGAIDQAIEYAKKNFIGEVNSEALEGITKALIQNGEIEKAVATVSKWYGNTDNSQKLIVEAYVKVDDMEKAIEFIRTMNWNMNNKAELQNFVIKTLIKRSYVERALNIAIKDPESPVIFKRVILALIENDQFDRAIEIATKIDLEDKTGALKSIFYALQERGEIDKAIEVVKKMQWNHERISALQYLREKLPTEENIRHADQVQQLLLEEHKLGKDRGQFGML
jgi:tetratricopeptide (TPR) repeat protein